jgi:hypothetical protein
MRIVFGFLLLFTVGCASMSGKKQTLLVRSEPSGAVISNQGQKLGVTPAFVDVDREKYPEIQLQFKDAPPEKFLLPTKYRWVDSFWRNFVWYVGAPIGWITDLGNGSAWQIQKPEPIKLVARGTSAPDPVSNTLAIAPPDFQDEEWTETLGKLTEEKLRAEKKWKIKPYLEIQKLFEEYDSFHGLSEDENDRNELLYKLKADNVFVSKVERGSDGKYRIRGHVLTPLKEKQSDPIEWEVEHLPESYTHSMFNRFRWLPNTLFVNFSSAHTDFDIGETTYESKYVNDGDFLDKALEYINTVNLTYMQRPRPNAIAQWRWNFFPSFFISKKKINLPYFPLDEIDYKRTSVSLAYGIEGGYQWGNNYLYMDVSPALMWSEIKYYSPVASESLSDVSTSAIVEIGYTYFATKHLVLKLFTRNVGENSDLWKEAIEKSLGLPNTNITMSATSLIAGVSVGYYFPKAPKTK